jgi:7-keto-8-aminopelargonate synthetase-like enzyme
MTSFLSEPLQQVVRTYVIRRGRKLSYFGGCDYFRMSSHPAVLKALRKGLREHGLNVAASRKTTGNHWIYESLEEELSRFFSAERAVLVSSGYLTNLAAAQSAVGHADFVLLDDKAHGSLRDAARAVGKPTCTFPRGDVDAMARLLRKTFRAKTGGGEAQPLVLTEGLFAQSGELAPLKEYLASLPPTGILLVDDAHAAGVIGSQGRGSLECHGLSREQVIQTITLSKAFGVYGGAILCSRSWQERIIEKSPVFVGNTPIPLPLATAALESIRILRGDGSHRERLSQNIGFIKGALKELGFPVPENDVPILSIVPADPARKQTLERELRARAIYPSYIQYPGGPAEGYFRFALSSEHRPRQLRDLLAALEAWWTTAGPSIREIRRVKPKSGGLPHG